MRRKRKKRRFISMRAVRLKPGGSLFMHRKNSHGERRTAALLCCTGMRIEEVLGLRWDDIDTERGCIHIRRAVVHPGRNMSEIKSTKSKAERTIPLPRHLLDELSPKEETGFLLNSYTDLSRETPLVIPKPQNRSNVSKNNAVSKGIPPMTFETLVQPSGANPAFLSI